MKNKKNTSKVQLLWEGKEEALLQHLTPTTQVYNIPSEIEGNEVHCVDNLDFLKLNQERLRGKVKCIYIDPPYNTGKDFIYKDKRHKRGECRHSQWLSFMLPRLKLARDLLREDGVIFVSIDDNEQANLKLLMDEVFGEENFVAIAPRKTGAGSAATRSDRELRKVHDFVLIYIKSESSILLKKFVGIKEFKEKDDLGFFTYGQFQVSGSAATRRERPNMYYPIYVLQDNTLTTKKTDNYIKEILPKKIKKEDGRWLWNKEKFEKDNKKYIVFDGNTLKRKIYKNEVEDLNVYQVEKAYFENYSNKEGTIYLNDILGEQIFNNPKPVSLIKHLLTISTTENDLVLDFFAGSGTTGQAVMELNHETKQPRNFILVQWNEEIAEGKEAHKFCVENGLEPVISSITIERLRRAGAKYTGDTSFKVYKYNLYQ